MKRLLQLFLFIALTSCSQAEESEHSKEGIAEESEKKDSVEVEAPKDNYPPQIEYAQDDLKITFSKLTDPYELGLYQHLKVSLSDSVLITIEEEYLELEAKNFDFSAQHVFRTDSVTYYSITANNRPEPSYHYLVQQVGQKLNLIGRTEGLTKELFGDIDNDGYLEIGGFNTYCQGTTEESFYDPDFCLDNFRVYEIRNAILRDTITEKEQIRRVRVERLENRI